MAKLVNFFCISTLFLFAAIPAAAQSPMITPSIVNLGSVSTPKTVSVELINETDKPLVITKIEADCRCTKITYSRRPIASNHRSTITVRYTPSAEAGVFYKAIKVHTTASDEPLKFVIRGTNKL